MLSPLWARLWASEEAFFLCTSNQTVHGRSNTNNVPNSIFKEFFYEFDENSLEQGDY